MACRRAWVSADQARCGSSPLEMPKSGSSVSRSLLRWWAGPGTMPGKGPGSNLAPCSRIEVSTSLIACLMHKLHISQESTWFYFLSE